MTFNLINMSQIERAPVMDYPYPYQIVTDLFKPTVSSSIMADFPKIDRAGRFQSTHFNLNELWQQLLAELNSMPFRERLEQLFEINLANKPSVVTLRGVSNRRDGRAQGDAKGKLLSVLLFMNPHWQATGGRFRILNQAHNMEDYTEEVLPEVGTALIYKPGVKTFHGYPKFVGRRQVLCLEYFASDLDISRYLLPQSPLARLKQLLLRV